MASIGGITLSLLLLPEFSLEIVNVVTYGVLSAAAVLVFFVNMMSTHRMMVAVKERELGRIRHRLAAASRALRQPERDSQVDRVLALADLKLWRAYEKQVDELPEWPYTDEIRRSLLVSLLLPLAAYLIPALLLEAARMFLFRAQ